MLKKLLTTMCILCVTLSMIGCSNITSTNSSNTSVSDNEVADTITPSNSSTPTPTPLEIDLYDLRLVSAAGNTGIKPAGELNFTPNSEVETIAQVATGASSYDMNRDDAFISEGITFYVFETEEDAIRAFEYIQTDIVRDSAVVENNSILGLDRNAVDIKITHFYYRNRNLIVYHLDFIGDPGSDSVESDSSIAINAALHEEIMTRWNY